MICLKATKRLRHLDGRFSSQVIAANRDKGALKNPIHRFSS